MGCCEVLDQGLRLGSREGDVVPERTGMHIAVAASLLNVEDLGDMTGVDLGE
jgi:hypothetical protein